MYSIGEGWHKCRTIKNAEHWILLWKHVANEISLSFCHASDIFFCSLKCPETTPGRGWPADRPASCPWWLHSGMWKQYASNCVNEVSFRHCQNMDRACGGWKWSSPFLCAAEVTESTITENWTWENGVPKNQIAVLKLSLNALHCGCWFLSHLVRLVTSPAGMP